MKLQQRTDFALRALLFLADSGGATPTAIADAHGISASHLAKVMSALSAAGFVRAERGRGKLATLARPAEDITVGDVVRTFEPFDLAECFRGDQCALTRRCNLQRALGDARDAFLAILDEVSLASLQTRTTRQLTRLRI
ncbi:MAG: Rrf2 family transcriptional regulator [Myxococcota bacterium]